MPRRRINIALVDDHSLIRSGIAKLISEYTESKKYVFKVEFEATDGFDMIQKLNSFPDPRIIILDINMPGMDGYDACDWLRKNKPDIKVLALTMHDSEPSIIKMLKAGARGYLTKDSDPEELLRALEAILEKGFYYSEDVSGKVLMSYSNTQTEKNGISLNEREKVFLKYLATELTLREIADKMLVSPRTVDGYKDSMYEKFDVKTRHGLVIQGIKSGLIKIE